jgi:hypothetical protein
VDVTDIDQRHIESAISKYEEYDLGLIWATEGHINVDVATVVKQGNDTYLVGFWLEYGIRGKYEKNIDRLQYLLINKEVDGTYEVIP